MSRLLRPSFAAVMAMAVVAICLSGCTSFSDYVHNGFKVGPNYCKPNAPVAEHWIDAADIHVNDDPELLCHWWTVFKDPKLTELINCAYRQNLTLRQAGFRILQARATRDIAIGSIFPQQQNARGSYARNAAAVGSRSSEGFGVQRYSDSFSYGFNLNWELDFWGRFRRAILAADANLDASVADYDYVLVTLLGDVANNYVTIRTTQERIELLQANVKLQQGVLDFIEKRVKVGKQLKLDADQAVSNLRQTEAGIPALEITKRQAENALCVLLGIPTVDLAKMLGAGPIPVSPPDVAVGIPADLLRRRPDVRKAERLAAAQAEQIGIAQTSLYPIFSITGSLGYAAQNFPDLFQNTAFNGSVGPSFQWNLLNYGRIVNNVKLQDAKFQELVTAYQNTVLTADEEVENGLVTFLRSQRRSRLLDESVVAAKSAVGTVVTQYKLGAVDFNRYATIEQNMVTQQDTSAQARGQIALGLIQVYRSLGGGWEIRLCDDETSDTTVVKHEHEKVRVVPQTETPKTPEVVPTPIPSAPTTSSEPDGSEDVAVTEPVVKEHIAKEPNALRVPIAVVESDGLKMPEVTDAPNSLREAVVKKEATSAKEPAVAKEAAAKESMPAKTVPAKELDAAPEPQPAKKPAANKGAGVSRKSADSMTRKVSWELALPEEGQGRAKQPTEAGPRLMPVDTKRLIEPDAMP
jgi:NodT family efflux transporter outer membrane factor (OMF) lipoprotein